MAEISQVQIPSGEIFDINDQTKLPLSGGEMTGRLIAKNGFNQLLTGTGTVGDTNTESPSFIPSKWIFDTQTPELIDGDIYAIKIPCAGSIHGVYISIDNGDHYYPVATQSSGRLTTQYNQNTSILIIFEEDGQLPSIAELNGSDNYTSVSGGIWRVLNFYDTNTNYHDAAYCATPSITREKVATLTNFHLLPNSYLFVSMYYPNTAKQLIALNISNTGFKPICINDGESSPVNYNLPAGLYLVYYDGQYYHFRTDGKIPGLGSMAYEDINNYTTTTSLNNFLPKTGGTLTGRLNAKHGINQVITGGTATGSVDNGYDANPRYVPTKWIFNTDYIPEIGDTIIIEKPRGGLSNYNLGVYLSLDNGSTFYPIKYNSVKKRGRFDINDASDYVLLIFCDPCYIDDIAHLNNGELIEYDSSGWSVINSNDLDTDTYTSALCVDTDGESPSKSCVLVNKAINIQPQSYLFVIFQYDNAAEFPLYLSINNLSKPLYINDVISSETNHTLPAGSYLTYFSGNAYYLRTDGKLPGIIQKAYADEDGNNIKSTYLPVSGGTITGSLVLSSKTDLSGTANNKPPLIVGGTDKQKHLEIDDNEIQAKLDGTTPYDLFLNNDGGKVHLNKIVVDDETITATTFNGNASTASKFNSARKVELTGDVTGSATTDGTNGWSIAATVADSSHNHKLNTIVTDDSQGVGTLDPVTAAFIGSSSSNKTFGLPADAITIEYSTDGGETWTDYGATNSEKMALFMETRNVYFTLGKADSKENNSIDNQLRVTIEPIDRYTVFNSIFVWISSRGNTIKMDLQKSTIGAKDTFSKVFENIPLGGFPGPNIKYFPQGHFGGVPNQTGNAYKYRITFKQTGINADNNSACIMDIRFLGISVFNPPTGDAKNMVLLNHLYSWDTNFNATFPAEITATKFNGDIDGNASTATKFLANQTIALTGDTTGSASSQAGWSIDTVTDQITPIALSGKNLDDYRTKLKTLFYYGGGGNNCTSHPIANGTQFGLISYASAAGHVTQELSSFNGSNNNLHGKWIRFWNSTSWSNWEKFLTSENFTDYTVDKSGTGATGTWGINISGNAKTTDKLKTAINFKIGNKTQSFDGSSGLTYNLDDLGITRNNIKVIESKTFTGILGTDKNTAVDDSFYFLKMRPTTFYVQWEFKYRIIATIPGQNNFHTTSTITLNGSGQANSSLVHVFNQIYSTGNRPIYYNNFYRVNQTGYNANYSNAIGVGLRNSNNRDTSGYGRTIVVEILETKNCTYEFLPSPIKWADWEGGSSTNYAGLQEFDAFTSGQTVSGDRNNTDRICHYNSHLTAGANGMRSYSIVMEDSTGKWQSFTTNDGIETSKTKNTTGFKLGQMYYYSGGAVASGKINGNNQIFSVITLIDFRYSSNCGNTLTAGKPVWIVGTMRNGLFYLDDTWWTQTPPTSADGKIYIPIGMAYNNYQVDFIGWNNAYYHNGTNFIPYFEASAMSQTLPISQGGTGATTASDARTNLGLGNIATYDTTDKTTIWNRVPRIGSDGVVEIGKYLDFHTTATAETDYDVRITALTTGIQISGITQGSFKGSLDGIASSSTALVSNGDNRSYQTVPSDYFNKVVFAGLKAKASINNPSTDAYSYVVGLNGWKDLSGGNSHEIAFNNHGIFTRMGTSGSEWGDWGQLLTSSNFSDFAVSKSGGTLTGGLTFQTTPGGAYNDKGIIFSSGSTISGCDNGIIGIYANNTIVLRPSYNNGGMDNGIIISKTSIIPSTTNMVSLGDTDHKWTNIYGNLVGDISGSAKTITDTLPVSKGGTGVTTLTSGQALIGNGTGAVTTRGIQNLNAKGNLGWTSQATATTLITTNTLAYWNGRFNGSQSNLTYCNYGAFGDIVTHSADDFLSTSGGIVDGTLQVTDLTAGNLVVNGTGRFINGIYGDVTGHATEDLALTGGTLTGRVINQSVYNQAFTGTGKPFEIQYQESQDSSGNTTYIPFTKPFRFIYDINLTPSEGDILFLKTPFSIIVGNDEFSYLLLSTDNGSTYHPVVPSFNEDINIKLYQDSYICIVYCANMTKETFPAEGGSEKVTMTGVWCVINNYYENTHMICVCNTDMNQPDKYLAETFVPFYKSYFPMYFKGNSVRSALTLTPNNPTGSGTTMQTRPIYINGKPSSASNCSLSSGHYLVYYDGSAYHFRTDGKLPGTTDGNLPLTGGTMTGRLTTKKAINQIITGTGTAGADKGSGVSPRYHPAKWTFNTGLTATDGDTFVIKIPVAGHDYGVYLSIDNGSHYYPVVMNGTSRLTTHFPVNTYLYVIFEPTGSAASMYDLDGGDARITVSGGVWRILNYRDTDTYPSAYCGTAAGTAAKGATCSGYVLLAKSYIQVIITNSNTYSGAITMNINGRGAKPIYINGAASSSSNHTLPAGSYLVYYDGSHYQFRTDGKIPGSGANASSVYLPTTMTNGTPGGWTEYEMVNGILYDK